MLASRSAMTALRRSRPKQRSCRPIEGRHAFSGAACVDLPGSAIRDDHVGKPGVLLEPISVNPRCRLDQIPAPMEHAVAQLDDSQVRPYLWPDTQDFAGESLDGKRWMRLRQEQDQCSRRTRKPGVAVNEKMKIG